MPRPKPKLNIPLYATAYLVLFGCFYYAWNQLFNKQAKNDKPKNIRLFVTNNSRNQEPLAIVIDDGHGIIYQDTLSEGFTDESIYARPGMHQFDIKIINRGVSQQLQSVLAPGHNYMLNITYEYEPPYAEAKRYLMEEAHQYEVARNKSRDSTYWSRYFDEHQYRFPEKPRSIKVEMSDYKKMKLSK